MKFPCIWHNPILNRPIAKILQVVLFAGSIIFLFITMVVVSAGWAKTCATYKKLMHQLTLRDDAGISITFNTVFKCTGSQNSLAGAIPPNGAEIITAAVSHEYIFSDEINPSDRFLLVLVLC